MDKKKVAIIGVTGSVGQEFVQSLDNHPWFEVTQIAASERSAGKNYLDAIKDASGIIAWDVAGEIPEYIKEMTVKSVDELDVSQLDLIFSAVESEAARDIETKMAADLPVISTSSAYRYEDDVPILIPGINDEQTELLEIQKKNRSEVLNKLNQKLKEVFNTDDTVIIRVKDEEDKRVFVYQLNLEYFEKIEELL